MRDSRLINVDLRDAQVVYPVGCLSYSVSPHMLSRLAIVSIIGNDSEPIHQLFCCLFWFSGLVAAAYGRGVIFSSPKLSVATLDGRRLGLGSAALMASSCLRTVGGPVLTHPSPLVCFHGDS